MSDPDLRCNECDKTLEWGDEYQLPEPPDTNAMCGECFHVV